MNRYELEAWAFSLDSEERPDAFLVVADAFEIYGDLKGAEIRRSWAEQMRRVYVPVKDPPETILGYYYSLETSHIHHDSRGQYRNGGSSAYLWDYYLSKALSSDFEPRSKNRPLKWYEKTGHWNRRKQLMKLSLAELIERNR